MGLLREVGLLASESISSRTFPLVQQWSFCVSRRRLQWRGPRRHLTGFPEHGYEPCSPLESKWKELARIVWIKQRRVQP